MSNTYTNSKNSYPFCIDQNIPQDIKLYIQDARFCFISDAPYTIQLRSVTPSKAVCVTMLAISGSRSIYIQADKTGKLTADSSDFIAANSYILLANTDCALYSVVSLYFLSLCAIYIPKNIFLTLSSGISHIKLGDKLTLILSYDISSSVELLSGYNTTLLTLDNTISILVALNAGTGRHALFKDWYLFLITGKTLLQIRKLLQGIYVINGLTKDIKITTTDTILLSDSSTKYSDKTVRDTLIKNLLYRIYLTTQSSDSSMV